MRFFLEFLRLDTSDPRYGGLTFAQWCSLAAIYLATAATRRQLLEYLVAFEADGVLLVCPERGAIHRVEFPGVRGAPRGALREAQGAASAARAGRRT